MMGVKLDAQGNILNNTKQLKQLKADKSKQREADILALHKKIWQIYVEYGYNINENEIALLCSCSLCTVSKVLSKEMRNRFKNIDALRP